MALTNRSPARTAAVVAMLCIAAAAAHGTAGGASEPSQCSIAAVAPATTDGRVALRNLNARIEGAERRCLSSDTYRTCALDLVEPLLLRGRIVGQIADYQHAFETAAALASRYPESARAHFLHAKALAALHHFDRALVALDRASSLGHSGAACDRVEQSIRLTQGMHAAKPQQPFEAFWHDAATSPFAVAEMAYEEGRFWMERGDPERARSCFAVAVARVPGFRKAAGHLAEMEAEVGNACAAVRRLEEIAATTDDPDYAAQLARIVPDCEDRAASDAQRWRGRAMTLYHERMNEHPEAFADHAAEFWLSVGNDPMRALQAARINHRVRDTARSRELLAAAMAAVGE